MSLLRGAVSKTFSSIRDEEGEADLKGLEELEEEARGEVPQEPQQAQGKVLGASATPGESGLQEGAALLLLQGIRRQTKGWVLDLW